MVKNAPAFAALFSAAHARLPSHQAWKTNEGRR